MSDRGPARDAPYTGVERSEATAWVGFVLLGAIMLVMLGAVHVGTGLVALARPEVLSEGRADLLLPIGLTGLAWLHIVIGAVAVVVGVGLVRGTVWARVAAILLAGTTAVVNFAFVGVYPVWSATAIAMAAIVIYAVAAHGAEVAGAYGDS
jgi:NAD(P)H-hydrate repair Nnr-like enzyme with NAD(P)H-hydrate dehydratase domain